MNSHDRWLQEPYERQEVEHELLQARIASEADAIMLECTNMDKAIEFADDYEALLFDRDMLIGVTCYILAETDMDLNEKRAAIGAFLIEKVKAAAMKRATYTCTENM